MSREKAEVKEPKRPTQQLTLTDFDIRVVKAALQSHTARMRQSGAKEDNPPSVRAMSLAEADEAQETLDSIREQLEG